MARYDVYHTFRRTDGHVPEVEADNAEHRKRLRLPGDARCEICNHNQIVDGFCSCWRGNHMQDGFFHYKKPTDVCGNFSRNPWAEASRK